MADGFDWWGDAAVVVPPQDAVAICRTGDGNVAIRQRGYPEDDTIIEVTPANVVAVIYGLIDAAGLPYTLIEGHGGTCRDVERPARPRVKDQQPEGEGPEAA